MKRATSTISKKEPISKLITSEQIAENVAESELTPNNRQLVPVKKNELLVPRSAPGSFAQYVQEIQKFPMLTPEEEYEYGMRYQEKGDTNAAKMLVQSHLRLVVKIAGKFRNYGLPVVDLVSEGNVGLMQAVKKFDPKKGFRFSTYAMWWIRAYIQEYILRTWSLVKIGTTAAQKKLFFNLAKIKKRINAGNEGNLLSSQIETIAADLNVSKTEVVEMNARLQQSDSSLNQLISDDDGEEVIDKIAIDEINQEQLAINNQEKNRREDALRLALGQLNERERSIIQARQLEENPPTLEELSKVYKVSRERIRQIEASAIGKMKKFMMQDPNLVAEKNELSPNQ